MQLLIDDLENRKYNELVPLKCERCGKEFWKITKEVRSAMKRNRLNYCSRRCSREGKGKLVSCAFCKKDIYKRPCDIRKSANTYCSLSCAAKNNNKNKKICPKKPIVRACTECGKDFIRGRNEKGLLSRKFKCDPCSIVKEIKYNQGFNDCTKAELFNRRKNWQSARSTIQKWARKILFDNSSDKECIICGYSLHVDACHIRGVADFPGDTLISVINHINNLVPMCKNHHTAYDDGYFSLLNS